MASFVKNRRVYDTAVCKLVADYTQPCRGHGGRFRHRFWRTDAGEIFEVYSFEGKAFIFAKFKSADETDQTVIWYETLDEAAYKISKALKISQLEAFKLCGIGLEYGTCVQDNSSS